MKNKYVFVTVLLLATALLGIGFVKGYAGYEIQKDEEELTIVTSFYPMYVAVLNVAGGIEGVRVENLSEPQTGCLHDFQLTSQDMRLLSGADAFVINGGGMESFLTEVAGEYPKLRVIDAGAGIFHEEEDNHAENAHIFMSMEHYREQILAICKGLTEIDPAHKEIYAEQAEAYLLKIHALQEETESLKDMAKGRPVVLFHEAFEYLAEDYGFVVEGVLNLDEERQVSAGEMADLIALIEQKNIQIILAEDLYGRDMGDTIEEETDCRVYYLDTLTRGDGSWDSWLRGMEENRKSLKDALKEGEEV